MATAVEAPASSTAEGPTSHTQNQLTALAKMREPFDSSQVSKLPKIWCGACNKAQYKVCDRHTRKRCDECDGNLTDGHLHLDYVGHAELTGRLLEADPLWTWEPMAFDEDGLPKFDHNGGLWIRLTVAGHTRLGYGDSQSKNGPNAVKEAIGDALRNAGMRFGAALTLWSKTDMDEASAQKQNLAVEPSREDRLEGLYGLMQKRWGNLDGLRDVKGQVGAQDFHESRVADADGVLHPFGELIDARIRELVDAAKVQMFLSKIRAGWDSLAATEQNLADAGTKKVLDHVVPAGPDKTPTCVEDLLKNRIAELSAGSDQAPHAPGPRAGAPASVDPLDRLMEQTQRCWNNADALGQVLTDAQNQQQGAREVEGPLGGWVPLSDLLTNRIAELKAATGGGTERNAA